MKKSENEKGCLISYGITILLTVAFLYIFLMGADGVAQQPVNNIVCNNYQDYECRYTIYCDGETGYNSVLPWCIRLCFDDGFEVYATDFDFFDGFLYPATGKKNLLGTAYIYYDFTGWAGYSVDLKGRSLTYRFSYIQNGNGCVEEGKCKQSNNCVYNTLSD